METAPVFFPGTRKPPATVYKFDRPKIDVETGAMRFGHRYSNDCRGLRLWTSGQACEMFAKTLTVPAHVSPGCKSADVPFLRGLTKNWETKSACVSPCKGMNSKNAGEGNANDPTSVKLSSVDAHCSCAPVASATRAAKASTADNVLQFPFITVIRKFVAPVAVNDSKMYAMAQVFNRVLDQDLKLANRMRQ